MVEKIPVLAVGVADVRLQDEQPAAGAEHAAHLARSRRAARPCRAGARRSCWQKHDVDAARSSQSSGARRRSALSMPGAASAAMLPGCCRRAILSGAADVVDELAEAGAEIEHGVGRPHVALKEVLAEHRPDARLGGALGGVKAMRVQRRCVHAAAPCAAPARTSAGSAAASAAV